MKKILAVALTAAAITANAQSADRETAQMMARCSAELSASASIVTEKSPSYSGLFDSAQKSLFISRKMYQNIGLPSSKADDEGRAWLGTLGRQAQQDPKYVQSYLAQEITACRGHNNQYRQFLN